MIAPVFESLSTKYSKPKKITFCKVDVDSQKDVAQKYSVRAMPTFLILHNGTVINTIQGANPPALTSAVEKAVKLAGPGGGNSFQSSGGHRLGGAGVGPRPGASVARPLRWDLNSIINAIISFFGLYFYSLFSVRVSSSLLRQQRGRLLIPMTSSIPTRRRRTHLLTSTTRRPRRSLEPLVLVPNQRRVRGSKHCLIWATRRILTFGWIV